MPAVARLAALVLAAGLVLAACSTSTGLVSPAPASPAPSASAAASVPASPVVGVVLKVDSAGLDKVSGFTLRTNAGQALALSIGILENGAQFPPGHLAEHLATAAPVRVWFRDENGSLVAYRIEDAG
jgi:uncharacterized lipoprotein YajG